MRTKSILTAIIATLFIFSFASFSTAADKMEGVKKPGNAPKMLPTDFKKVSTLVQLPEYLPGMGTLYVNPATLPAGPFLGYNKKGKLVNAIYMIPATEFNEKMAMNNLGKEIPGLRVNHVDLMYNAGHPGVAEPHYHITLWLISHDEEMKMMK